MEADSAHRVPKRHENELSIFVIEQRQEIKRNTDRKPDTARCFAEPAARRHEKAESVVQQDRQDQH